MEAGKQRTLLRKIRAAIKAIEADRLLGERTLINTYRLEVLHAQERRTLAGLEPLRVRVR